MKKYASLLLSLSIFFLALDIISFGDIQEKTLFTAAGIVFGVAGIVFVAACRSRAKRHWLTAGGLVIGYGLYLTLGFQTSDLGSFFPDGYMIESVDIILATTGERVIWTPGGGEPELSDEDGWLILNGGSAESMAQKAEDIIIRNYWWPGAMESSKVSEISVYLTNGESSSRLSLYQDGGAEYSIAESLEDSGRQWSHWLLFGDLTDLLPQEIIDLLP